MSTCYAQTRSWLQYMPNQIVATKLQIKLSPATIYIFGDFVGRHQTLRQKSQKLPKSNILKKNIISASKNNMRPPPREIGD